MIIGGGWRSRREGNLSGFPGCARGDVGGFTANDVVHLILKIRYLRFEKVFIVYSSLFIDFGFWVPGSGADGHHSGTDGVSIDE